MEGYIYVLSNPSMPNLFKIGKTTRDPFTRTEELSSSTGIPTPFTLVFQQQFFDCHNAEKQIHGLFATYRLSNSREFFQLPLADIIKAILELKEENEKIHQQMDKDVKRVINSIEEQREQLLDTAICKYLGLSSVIQDPTEARDVFYQARSLGNIYANRWLGIMYYLGDGGKRSEKKAFDYLKEGLNNGDVHCAIVLALLSMDSRRYYNEENSQKYWQVYFDHLDNIKQSEEEYLFMYEFITREIKTDKSPSPYTLRVLQYHQANFNHYLNNRLRRQISKDLTKQDRILLYFENFLSALQGSIGILLKDPKLHVNQTYHITPHSKNGMEYLVYSHKYELSLNGDQPKECYQFQFSEGKNSNMLNVFVDMMERYINEEKVFAIYTNNSIPFIEYISEFLSNKPVNNSILNYPNEQINWRLRK